MDKLWGDLELKYVRYIIGLVVCMLVLLLLFWGVHELEQSEIRDAKDQERKQQLSEHSSVYAWITVEGSKIDYPIVQHSTDDTYYLSHDVEGHPTDYGAIFTEKINTKTFEDPVTIVYGHAMRDDTMFGSLDYLADKSFFDQHRIITIETKNAHYQYEIVAAYRFVDDHLYHTYHLGEKEEIMRYVEELESTAYRYGGFYRPIPMNIETDKLLILSTCDTQSDGMRFIVHAIRKGAQ